MLPGRITCRRRRSLRCLVVLVAIICIQAFLFFFSLNTVSFKQTKDPYLYRSPVSFLGRGNGTDGMCRVPDNLNRKGLADVFTYDLPDITDYSFVKGKRFKEYVIPVKTEKEAAYGPNLDPVTVLLIPFSHVDPGYGKTMEQYYNDQTKHTLDHLVRKLDEYRDFTFQWVETVFLERWWRDIDDDTKRMVREQVQRGQFEIAQGGWVMPDEASTHYVAVVDQLLEGHQWVVEHLGIKPRNSWSNDPFGFSSTMPYLWKKSGMENMVILRIHQAIKATLMKQKTMEFNWRPLWADSSNQDILCHLMPYRGYWIGDVCGPYNQHICREYAFMREQPVHKVVFLTDDNLEERARVLYEQYRITAEIYRRHEPGTNTELVLPMYLGEDFSYTSAREYDLIYQNFDRLMKFINRKTEWKMKFKFGTTDEYFTLLRKYQNKRLTEDVGGRFPTLAGDFFPYSDYQNDYWTGYYTTRPFNKQFSREIQSLVRMADILHAYAYAYSRSIGFDYEQFGDVSSKLRAARRDLGMFLHHDGITGTSVTPVIYDFQTRLYDSYTFAQSAIKSSLSVLMTEGKLSDGSLFTPTKDRKSKTDVSTLGVLSISPTGSKLLVTNSVGRFKEDVITIKSDSSSVEILDSENRPVVTQVTKDTNGVQISFKAGVPALGIHAYKIKPLSGPPVTLSEESTTDRTIENEFLKLTFDETTGQLSELHDKRGNGKVTTFRTELLAYDSARSGAYIFAPTGEAKQLFNDVKPDVVVRKGPVYSDVQVSHPGFKITYCLNMGSDISCRGVLIKTELSMTGFSQTMTNKEVILRFESDLHTGNAFYTDQNGFQLIGRKNFPDRSIEQNYYPLTSMAVLEDSTRRMTLHSGQPHGFASLKSGSFEVMLDRRVSRDDDKGLGQGITDNRLTHADFILQLEERHGFKIQDEVKYSYPSQNAIFLNQHVLDPLYSVFLKDGIGKSSGLVAPLFSPLKQDLPCDISLVGLRNLVKSDLQYNGTSVILHRKSNVCGFEGEYNNNNCSPRAVTLNTLFPGLNVKSGLETSLTHLHEVGAIGKTEGMEPEHNELRAFKLTF